MNERVEDVREHNDEYVKRFGENFPTTRSIGCAAGGDADWVPYQKRYVKVHRTNEGQTFNLVEPAGCRYGYPKWMADWKDTEELRKFVNKAACKALLDFKGDHWSASVHTSISTYGGHGESPEEALTAAVKIMLQDRADRVARLQADLAAAERTMVEAEKLAERINKAMNKVTSKAEAASVEETHDA